MKTALTLALLVLYSLCSAQSQKNIELLFQKGKSEKVVEKGKKLLESEPNNLTVNHLVGRSLTDIKKYEEAKAYLQKSIADNSPDWMKAWSYGYLGLCFYITDDYSQSKSYLNKAVALGATKNSTNYAQKQLQTFQMGPYFDDWINVETENIRFHIQPGHGIKDLESYCHKREEAFKEVNTFFQAAPYKKIDFFVWSRVEDAPEVVGKRLGFANSELCIINSRTDQTIGHEITHILSDYGIRPKTKSRLINEGVAVAFDLTNRNRLKLAKGANDANYSIKELMENERELPERIIYPIGGALIDFLRRHGSDEQLKQLIRAQTYDQLITLYGEALIKAFEEKMSH
jgi:tetratricopeptide (TPR) repeat protein